MLQHPYQEGQAEALGAFGVEKTAISAPLLLGLGGLGAGYAMSQPGEESQGSILGGLGGLAAGFGLQAAGRGLGRLGRAAGGLAARAGRGVMGLNRVGQGTVDALKNYSVAGAAGQQIAGALPAGQAPRALPPMGGTTRAPASMGPIPQGPSSLPQQGQLPPGPAAPPMLPPPRGMVPASQAIIPMQAGPAGAYAMAAKRASELYGVKEADWQFGVSPNQLPFRIGYSDKATRLEGMHRFVSPDVINQAYEGIDQGHDPQAILDTAKDTGSLLHPGVGAALGAYGVHRFLPSGGLPGMALGALAGGGLGAIYNAATAGDRIRDMSEALRGIQLEDQKRVSRLSAIGGQPSTTANESNPLLVSRGEA